MVRQSEEQIIAERKKHLSLLRQKGIDPYPNQGLRSAPLGEVIKRFAVFKRQKKLSVVGRLWAKREHGGLLFADLKDESGTLQLLFRKDDLEREQFKLLELVDAGDFLQAEGSLMVSKQGEKTLLVKRFLLLAKALRPLPNRWYGLKDIETRYRQRYLDILFNREVSERLVVKHRVIQALREFLVKEGFLEFETPALQSMPGGALAAPFKTYYEAEDCEVYLRIAPELYLKRLIVAGFEKVFEFARVFRNEGVSREHLQDFTMLEFYQAYANYEELMKFTERLIIDVVKKIHPSLKLKWGNQVINFKPPWKRVSLCQVIKKYSGIDIDRIKEREELGEAIKDRGIKLTFQGKASWAKLVDELYKETARPNLRGPLFLIDHPLSLSPLAKRKKDDPEKVERFQLVIGGWEIVNAFSELNDPVDQRLRFEAQLKQKKEGDQEAHPYDQEFIEALEYGMPPTAGWGMGLERWVALLTNADSVREAVTFPFVKPRLRK